MKIEVARFNATLGRLLSLSGVENPAGDLSPEISAVICMESDRPEWLYLGNQRLVAGGLGLAATALAGGAGRFHNPAESGILAVFHTLTVSAATAPQRVVVRLTTPAVDLGTLVATAQASRDSRLTTTVGAVRTSVETISLGGVGVPVFQGWCPAGETILIPVTPIVLAPGSSFTVCATEEVVSQMYVNATWCERAIQPYER